MSVLCRRRETPQPTRRSEGGAAAGGTKVNGLPKANDLPKANGLSAGGRTGRWRASSLAQLRWLQERVEQGQREGRLFDAQGESHALYGVSQSVCVIISAVPCTVWWC